MRLDNFVSKALGISRKESKRLISKSQLQVNHLAVNQSNWQLKESDVVEYKNQTLSVKKHRYYMLNKPVGFICSTVDEAMPSALNLLQVKHLTGLHFAGRLDADTTGLVLISDDGQWTHRVSSPKHKQSKTYRVEAAEVITANHVASLEQGILLKDSDKPTLPAKVELLNEFILRLTIYEGRYHQVKRMFAAIGNHVVNLHRESIGHIKLDTDLEIGCWRELLQSEVVLFD
jgi:16S rRNA pseudouridine516 synthase